MDNVTNRDENIIKRVRREYNLSYSELSEITGAKEGTLQNASSSGEISEIIQRCLEWYISYRIENDKNNNTNYLKTALKKFIHE